MKTLAKILGGLVALIVLAAIAIPLFVSVEDLAEPIGEQVTAATGRTLTVSGDTSLSIFPSLAITLNEVALSNMEGGSREAMMTMAQLDIYIPWMALFSGQLSVDRFVIREPDILLETDAAGTPNWNLTGPTEPVAEQPAETGAVALPAGFDISLGQVAISGGNLTYLDGVTGSATRLENLELAVSLPSLREELTVNGELTYQGETFKLSLGVNTLARILGGEAFELAAAIDSRLVQLDYAGTINADASLAGSLQLQIDSVKELLAWQELDIPSKDNALNQLTLGADLSFGDDQLGLQALKLTLDELAINGSAQITLTEVPQISANVDLGMLNVNPYLPDTPAGAATEAKPQAAPAADQPAQPIVWDSTPIDLSGLGAVDADIKVRSTGLVFQDIKLGETSLSLVLKKGKLNLGLDKFNAYEGKGKGRVVLDSSKTPYRLSTRFDLSGIQAQPLLRDAAGFDKLLGKGELNIDLNTRGKHQKAFINALAGKVSFNFSDGAVSGANVAQLLRSAEQLLQGNLGGASLDTSFDNAAQTDFSEMKGSMQFGKGVGVNNDLLLASPLIRIKGSGNVNLPATTVDYTVNARLVSTIEGQGGSKGTGVGIPINIDGPFHDISIKPDVSAAAKEEVKERATKELFKRFGF